ncbi:MAG: 5-formyltetrahydrofolate cyclo-ligase [Legionella sp.]|nr:MAG: 5-formyltetrahydrofolate cyclo-ligase [Legionella sp.]
MIDPYKNILRTTLKQLRQNTSATFRLTASQRICNGIKQLTCYRKARHLALYSAIHGEVDLHGLWSTAPLQGKYCYFPVMNADLTLSFVPATPATKFKKNSHGILEPEVDKDQAIAIHRLDVIILPLVGFDNQCRRLGMGAGYYDRTLAHEQHPVLVGAAYQFQHLPFIHTKPWDVPMDVVITEKNHYWRQV